MPDEYTTREQTAVSELVGLAEMHLQTLPPGATRALVRLLYDSLQDYADERWSARYWHISSAPGAFVCGAVKQGDALAAMCPACWDLTVLGGAASHLMAAILAEGDAWAPADVQSVQEDPR
jgi:hypothetical protein